VKRDGRRKRKSFQHRADKAIPGKWSPGNERVKVTHLGAK
jgi:hypothetical protein